MQHLIKGTDDERGKRFRKIVERTIKYADPGYGKEHVEDRAIAITQFIKDVLKKVEEISPELRVSEIIPVGGFNEGTKIKAADEFDFLIVIEKLSKPGAVIIVRDDITEHGHVNIKLTPETDPEGKWKKFCRDGYLTCFEEVRQTKKEDSFPFQVLRAIPELEQNRPRKKLTNWCRTNRQVTFRCRPEIIYSRKRPAEHIAMIQNAEVWNPNILLEFLFHGRYVSADLCPAIRYNKVEDLFDPKFCLNERLSREVLGKGSILLVGKGNAEYRVTYTETELDYMKRKITKGHKDLYIFLKIIVNIFKDNFKPSSYSLKVTCIKHDLQCKNTDASKSFLQCFDEIIDDIIQWNKEGVLPSIFDKRLNLLRSHIYVRIEPTYRLEVIVPLFKDIKKLCHNVNMQSPERFLEQIRAIVVSREKNYKSSILSVYGYILKRKESFFSSPRWV